MNNETWKGLMPEFREKTKAFYSGELSKNEYKGFSGLYGSYAQKSGQASMLRLRMTAGRVTKEKLKFVADAIRKYQVKRAHFTTCETIQLHDLDGDTAANIMEEAIDAGIITMGGGGDFPRNIMCSPLSGVEKGEYFDVRPYAEAAGGYLMDFILAEKMPRKLKVCFSNSPANLPHATFRDLGFVAREDGKFDVYSAGGLGNNPSFGVQVAEAVEPEDILYYIKAMWLTFRTYGNYENRGKARTRFMVEKLGGAEKYKAAYLEKLQEVIDSGEDLKLAVEAAPVKKTGDGSVVDNKRAIEQKQEGLYAVAWNPPGGRPKVEDLCALSDAIADMEDVEVYLAPDKTAYVVNLTGTEASKILDLTADTAQTLFERSVACVGASTCQVGLRDSQALLHACIQAVRQAEIVDGALPQIHISGCPSSCGTHQTGAIGFRGASKKGVPAFVMYINGNDRQGQETMGEEIGFVPEDKIPQLLVKIGQAVQASGLDYQTWNEQNPEELKKIGAEFLI
jgi:ferredoxin-nitrite reductase